ncbi:MAG: ATP-grasp domain-containing protein, partial [Burkholderiaceae bacterium]|nr:ATP-grasp domain-containing protein [Burkholderiaceae bacterium]
LREVGFAHGFFNMEFFHDPASDRLAVIEFNPRLASQFGDLYRAVQGIDPHAMALALAAGQDPASLPRRAPTAGVAASLVWRAFDPAQVPAMPSRRQQAALAAAFPDAPLSLYPKSGHALARDFKWLDSTRYGVVNLGARDWMALREASAQVSALLGWPDAPFASDAMTAHEAAAGATEVLQGAE